ncbi:hypothetical protein B0H11DRAFT_2332327 [Mycena galericulata]|nr:hypothetical protein B0H11DRAFT_2386110 [Mycena galericulata]KAJ7449340.1 hypothetical protein B0H11DRAFT_2332327 [Mycena galericulata]
MTFILSIMKALDIHSEGAVKLLAELLDLDAPGPYEEGGRHRNAEHFAHVEVYTYVRSPYRDLFVSCSTMSAQFRCLSTLALPLERGRWERENEDDPPTGGKRWPLPPLSLPPLPRHLLLPTLVVTRPIRSAPLR